MSFLNQSQEVNPCILRKRKGKSMLINDSVSCNPGRPACNNN